MILGPMGHGAHGAALAAPWMGPMGLGFRFRVRVLWVQGSRFNKGFGCNQLIKVQGSGRLGLGFRFRVQGLGSGFRV